MYLQHFNLAKTPFAITPDTQFFCELPSHQTALNTLLVSLRQGEGFIKIVGEVGTGKTLLCRLLLNKLDAEGFVTAYIPNPDLQPDALRKAVAQELHIELLGDEDQHSLLDKINQRLLALHQQGQRVVLLLDEAQALPIASLETLRLLTNLETETDKLLQVVLFAQPELDKHLAQDNLRQLRQRISFSVNLRPLTKHELQHYIQHRLAIAGYTYGDLFSRNACRALLRHSKGMPRIVNLVCHKALLLAYGKGTRHITKSMLKQAIRETEGVNSSHKKIIWFAATAVILLCMIWIIR